MVKVKPDKEAIKPKKGYKRLRKTKFQSAVGLENLDVELDTNRENEEEKEIHSEQRI